MVRRHHLRRHDAPAAVSRLTWWGYAGRTFYGHESWIALVVFFGVFALRALSSQRRRPGRRRGAPPASSFTDPTFRGQGDDAPGTAPGGVTFTGIPPGWLIDPSGRHERRYWSGSAWTEHVSDGGVPGTDPPPGAPGPDAS